MNQPANPIRAGESLPVPPTHIPTWRPPEEIPQRADYVPPVDTRDENALVLIPHKDAMAIHKFLEVNAVYPEERAMADRLRAIIASR
jgi:hypothetical protein